MESLQLLMLYLVTGGAVAGVRYEVVPMANTTSGSFIIPNSNVIFLFSLITAACVHWLDREIVPPAPPRSLLSHITSTLNI